MINIDKILATRTDENKILINIMKIFSYLGNYNLIWIIISIVLYIMNDINYSFYIIISMLVISAISSGLFKSLFRRKRPYEQFDAIKLFIKQPYGSSFPSEHAAISAGVSIILLQYNLLIGIFACVLSLLISISRVYLKVNYLTDILFGAFIGILIIMIILYLDVYTIFVN